MSRQFPKGRGRIPASFQDRERSPFAAATNVWTVPHSALPVLLRFEPKLQRSGLKPWDPCKK